MSVHFCFLSNRGRASRRRAATLTEILVAISVIGVLIALLLPAVQAAREAARGVACRNNLRQLAFACDMFHNAQNTYPPGQAGGAYGWGPDSRAWSWLARTLPFVEQGNLYDSGSVPSSTLRTSGIANSAVATFFCPSASALKVRNDAGNLFGFEVATTNYKGVSGANWGYDETLGGWINSQFINNGSNGSFDGLNHGDGLLWRNDISGRSRNSDVLDGLSNTFLIGEDIPQLNQWCSWAYSNNAYGTCAIPPNLNPGHSFDFANSWSFRSRHPGGLNFALADSSVRFVAETIELRVYRALATRAGAEAATFADP